MTDIVIDRFGNERILRDGEIVGDGERLRVGMTAMDSLQRAIYESTRAQVADTRVVDGRPEAYRLCLIDEQNAWRRPDGAYPLSAGEGNACTLNGEPGHLVRADDGPWLVCGADTADAAPARTDSLQRRAEALLLKDAMQRLNDARAAAYAEVEERDRTSWMRPITSGISR
jgi:hypothetical protein